ncbi:MAG: FMN-binding protein [Micrococcales bacterium]|nr:FMN-binding protein [Micrococcales bacterium]
MTANLARITLVTAGSVVAVGGLVGAKTLLTDAAPSPEPAPHMTMGVDMPGGQMDPTALASAPAPQPSGTAAASPNPGGGTYTGKAAPTRYGDVQVQIDVSSGHIDDIRVVAYPNNGRRDATINQRAIPILVSEGLAAQSATVDTVSGATYTSDGYRKSLQSAIDQAGL